MTLKFVTPDWWLLYCWLLYLWLLNWFSKLVTPKLYPLWLRGQIQQLRTVAATNAFQSWNKSKCQYQNYGRFILFWNFIPYAATLVPPLGYCTVSICEKGSLLNCFPISKLCSKLNAYLKMMFHFRWNLLNLSATFSKPPVEMNLLINHTACSAEEDARHGLVVP